MAQKNNATCSICGKDYYMCLSCRDSVKANPWKMHTDTAEHYKVYQVIHGVSTGVYTKDEAKSKLNNIDLRDLNSFRPHIKKIIKDILKEEKPVIKVVEKVEELVIEKVEEPVENEVVSNDFVLENVNVVENVENIENHFSRKRSRIAEE